MSPRFRADVWSALSEHKFVSVLQMALGTNGGDLLVDAYLDEPQLIDDFVVLKEVFAEVGYPLRR